MWGWPRAAPPCRIISAGGGEITISGEPSSLGDRVLPLTSAPRKRAPSIRRYQNNLHYLILYYIILTYIF